MTIVLMCLVAMFQSAETNPANDTIRGNVSTASGEPIEGAKIAMTWREPLELETSTQIAESDALGSFEFPVSPDRKGYWSLLVYQPGFTLGTHFGKPVLQAGNEFKYVEIELQPASNIRVDVLDPENQPVATGRIKLRDMYLSRLYPAPSRDALNLLPESEIVDGQATVENLIPQGYSTIEIESEGLAMQTAILQFDQANPSFKVQLQPICQLNGKLIDVDDTGSFQDVQVLIRTSSTVEGELIQAAGELIIDVAEDGTFESDQIPAGMLSVSCSFPNGARFLKENGRLSPAVQVSPDKPATIQLEVLRSIRVTGKIIGDDGSPVENVKLNFSGVSAKTDNNGNYSIWLKPGTNFGQIAEPPAPWLKPPGRMWYLTVPKGVATFESETVQLERAVSIQGKVIDENDDPIAGVMVAAEWQVSSQDGAIQRGTAFTRSSDDGSFELKKTSGSVRVRISADSATHASASDVTVGPGDSREIKIVALASEKMAIACTIVDQDGVPVPSAKVEVWSVYDYGRTVTSFNNSRYLYADEAGQIRTPGSMTRRRRHKIVVKADGYSTLQSEEYPSPTEGDLDLGNIEIKRVAGLVGSVVDLTGKPIAGANVWTFSGDKGVGRRPGDRTSTTTEADGSFSLSGIVPNARFFFVEHADYRFTGAVIPQVGQSASVKLARPDQPAVDLPVSLLTRSELRQGQWLSAIAEPILKDRSETGSETARVFILKLLAAFDTELVANELQELKKADSQFEVLLALGEIDEALQVATSMETDSVFYRLTNEVANDRHTLEVKRRLLGEAIKLISGADSPDRRVSYSGTAITLLRRVGDHQGAARLLQQHKEFVMNNDVSDLPTSRFAQALSPVDPSASLELVQRIEREFTRWTAFSNAVASAGTGGVAAVKTLLGNSRDPADDAGNLTRAVYELAKIDLEATLKLVDEAEDRYGGLNKAKSYGFIALAIHDQEPLRAKELLREAFSILGKKGMQYQDHEAFRLLRMAEVIDPESTGEYWWRTVSVYGGPLPTFSNASKVVIEQLPNAKLAMLLSLYDRFPEIQDEVIGPIFEYWESAATPADDTFRFGDSCVAAMVLCDPERTVALLNKWWPNSGQRYRRIPDTPWMLAAEMLAVDGAELSRLISAKVHHKWLLGWDFRYR